nr:nucleotide exchange factor GrpE [Chloroflexota bacterium]
MTDHPANGGPKPRTRTRGQERADAIKTPSRLELAERIEVLGRELIEARAKAEEHLYNWQRSAADFSNFKRRTDEERATIGQFSNAILINKLLAVLDDFDRALDSVPADAQDPWIEGVRLVERKMRNVLEAEGVTP